MEAVKLAFEMAKGDDTKSTMREVVKERAEVCPYDVGPGCPCRPCACHLGRAGKKPAAHPNYPR